MGRRRDFKGLAHEIVEAGSLETQESYSSNPKKIHWQGSFLFRGSQTEFY